MGVEVETGRSSDVIEDYTQYRALSVLAVASCILGLLSATSFLAWALAMIVPPLGIVTGLIALCAFAAILPR